MLNSDQIFPPEDLDTVSVATILLRSAQILIGRGDVLARALLEHAAVAMAEATSGFAAPSRSATDLAFVMIDDGRTNTPPLLFWRSP